MKWQQLDSLSYQNRLRHLPPVHKLLMGTVLLLVVLTGHALVQILVFAWMGMWVVGYARIPLRSYLFFLVLSLSFFAAGMPALLLEAGRAGSVVLPRDVLASWDIGEYILYISQGSLDRVLTLFCRTMASLACFSFILFTVPFAEILQVLRRIGMPALVTDLLMIMYRFLFVLLETSHQLWVAQRSRGGHQEFRALLRDAGQLAVQLFVRAMRRYQSLSQGMAARGFAENFHVISLARHRRSPRYEWESAAGCIVLILIEWWTGGWQL